MDEIQRKLLEAEIRYMRRHRRIDEIEMAVRGVAVLLFVIAAIGYMVWQYFSR